MDGRLAILKVGLEVKGSKSDKIRWLLEAGFTKGEISAAMGVVYQMVFQIEKRMGEQYKRFLQPKEEKRYYWER